MGLYFGSIGGRESAWVALGGRRVEREGCSRPYRCLNNMESGEDLCPRRRGLTATSPLPPRAPAPTAPLRAPATPRAPSAEPWAPSSAADLREAAGGG